MNGQITVRNKKVTFNYRNLTLNLNEQDIALSKTDAERRKFGVDLFMFAEGDLFGQNIEGDVVARSTNKRDLRVASGVYNFAQAITHRLMTTRGTHPEDPNFGVPWNMYLQRTYSDSDVVIMSLEADIADEISKDSRTGRILELSSTFLNPNVILTETTILPAGYSENFTVELEVGL